MALGGGTFTAQNKILPGSYINFISAANTDVSLSDRGTAAFAIDTDWGIDGEIYKVTREEFVKKSLEIFGYEFKDEKLKSLRDLFLNIHTLYTYNLSSGGARAKNDLAVAKYPGERGNDLKITINSNIDQVGAYDVITILDSKIVDEQTVTGAEALKDNAFVEFIKEGELTETAGTPLSGGTNGDATGDSHSEFLKKLERYQFNALGVAVNDKTVNALYAEHARYMREERGVKFQAVVYNTPADFEGVVNVKNKVTDDGAKESDLVYWVTGLVAGTPVNESALNAIYTGEFTPDVEFTQAELEDTIKNGEFTVHQVGEEIRVLNDINSLTTLTDEKGKEFQDNQTIRIIDQIATDIAHLFNTRYLGRVPNDAAGRVSLQADIVTHHQNLQNIRAIEDFEEDDVTVEIGDDKKTVVVQDAVTVVNTMEKLYMSVVIQ